MTEAAFFFISLSAIAALVLLCAWCTAGFFDDVPKYDDDDESGT